MHGQQNVKICKVGNSSQTTERQLPELNSYRFKMSEPFCCFINFAMSSKFFWAVTVCRLLNRSLRLDISYCAMTQRIVQKTCMNSRNCSENLMSHGKSSSCC